MSDEQKLHALSEAIVRCNELIQGTDVDREPDVYERLSSARHELRVLHRELVRKLCHV